MNRNQYDQDISIWSPQGKIYQIDYAMEAVKQGSATVGLKSKDYAVLVALKRSSSELSSHQKKIISIDDHVAASIAGLTSDGRLLCNFMREECLDSRFQYDRELPISRLVTATAEKMQKPTKVYGRRAYGVGLLVAGYDTQGPHIFQLAPSSNYFDCKAMAIGARSQSAKTYLEKHLDSFKESSKEEIILHGLRALRECLPNEQELTVKNCTVAIVGPLEPDDRTGKPLIVLDNDDVGPFLGKIDQTKGRRPAAGTEGDEAMEEDTEEQRNEQRKRNLLLLILHFLEEERYLDSVQCLEKEAGVNLKKFEICDNIDLQTILQEYESYFYVKFNKWPKITKRNRKENDNSQRSQSSKVAATKRNPSSKKKSNSFSLPSINGACDDYEPNQQTVKQQRPSSDTKKVAKPKQSKQLQESKVRPSISSETFSSDDISLSGSSIAANQNSPNREKPHGKKTIVDYRAILSNTLKGECLTDLDPSERLLKPLAGYAGITGEYRDLASVITRDIYLENPNVHWNSIIGLDEAKRLIKEAVVYPIKYPQLFTGILSPWKGLLLYGPPGTGKTLLAKAVATECNTTFFNISASTIVSKWRGDSEKLVRVLFDLARFHAPSTIFVDELDALMSQRGTASGGSGEHEGSRRMKTELLVQMDGLTKSDDLVFLLAASNIPWELDLAMLRRLEKRILVDLPTKAARFEMLRHHLPPVITPVEEGLHMTTNIDYESLAEKTEGYSGSDIRLLCKEAAMRPVRKIFDLLEKQPDSFANLPMLQVEPVLTSDVEAALQRTKPSARSSTEKYKQWQQEFESV